MNSILYLLVRLVDFYSLLVFVYCLMSWIPMSAGGWVADIRGVLASVCEPYLGLFRGLIPPMGGIDFSPMVAILALQLGERLVIQLLW